MFQLSRLRRNIAKPGIVAGLSSALLFGAGTPLAKMLLVDTSPWLMAGLLYLGSGIGLTVYRLLRREPAVRLQREDWSWLAAAIFTGGVLGPGLQMLGLTNMPASGASLLLNAESVFTALLAWFVFAPGLVCLQGEFRQTHCARHGGHTHRPSGSQLARSDEICGCSACLIRNRGLFLWRQLGTFRHRAAPPRNGTNWSIFLCGSVFRSSSFDCIPWGIYQCETPSRRNPDGHRALATPYGAAHPPAPACGNGS